jgi:shikimate kinase
MTTASLAGRPVAFCGFMGSGKTAVGRRVAHSLGRAFFDCDALIVQRLGRSIPDLFANGDEPLFRSTEARVVADLVLERPAGVISLGGGALENRQTRDLVLGSTAAVYLDRPLAAILASLDRLRLTRPLLAGRSDDEISELHRSRVAAFAQCPITIEVEHRTVEGVVVCVLDALRAHGIVSDLDE